MKKFSLKGCQALWFKKAKVPKRDRQAILADLRGMSHLVEEAMSYTKKRQRRETAVRFSLNTEENFHGYYLKIYYEPGMKAWSVTINRIPKDFVGNIVSEKWSLCQTFNDKNYRVPETI